MNIERGGDGKTKMKDMCLGTEKERQKDRQTCTNTERQKERWYDFNTERKMEGQKNTKKVGKAKIYEERWRVLSDLTQKH